MTPPTRILSALLLTPGTTLLLVWIARFAGPDEAARMGTLQFLLLATGTGFAIAAIITLYVAYITKTMHRE